LDLEAPGLSLLVNPALSVANLRVTTQKLCVSYNFTVRHELTTRRALGLP